MAFPTFLTIRSWKTQGVIIKAIYSLVNVLLIQLFAVWQWVIALGGDNTSMCEVLHGDSLRPNQPPKGETHPKNPRRALACAWWAMGSQGRTRDSGQVRGFGGSVLQRWSPALVSIITIG